MAYDTLDDAAVAALWMLGTARPATERLGLIYGEDFQRTPTQGQGAQEHVKGAFAIPRGSLKALFHNHPQLVRGDEHDREQFSKDDRQQAQMLHVPSYISAGDKVRRFDPASGATSEVLAQFPIDWVRSKYLAQGLLK